MLNFRIGHGNEQVAALIPNLKTGLTITQKKNIVIMYQAIHFFYRLD